MLWHQCFGHMRKKGLFVIHSKGMVKVFSNFSYEFDLYEHCGYGKQNCVILPTRATKSKVILELVHSDVFGLVSVPSLEQYGYYVYFINHLSRMTWLYFLKKKLDVF